MNKKILSIFYILLIFSVSVFLSYFISGKAKEQDKYLNNIENIKYIAKERKPQTTLYFVGDIMLDRGVKSSVENNFEGNYDKLFENLTDLKKADILFGNLEGPISDIGNNVGSKYSFRMEPAVLDSLEKAGFDIFSFANNHVGDWNTSAFKDTLLRLKARDIKKTGAGLNKKEAVTPTIIEKNGIKFGFLGFSDVGPNWMESKENSPGILLASDPNFEEIIKKAKQDSDVLIVSFHFGEEYKTVHNQRQENLSHLAVDAGANLVIGHHPHVIQDIEYYKEVPIVYSLGNFIFDQHFSKETMRGMIFKITFEENEIKEIKKQVIILNKQYQPMGIYEEKNIDDIEEIVYSSCPKPSKEYDDMTFLNLNQENSLPDTSYIPQNLVEIGNLATREDICLIQEAKKSLALMITKAKEDNLNIKATSAYRSFSYQENLLENAIKNGNKNASIAIAKAGYSEHQLGTAIDLSGSSIGYASTLTRFGGTPEDLWLNENAHKYGFVQSYPINKEEITGYMYEPWHYRYLGPEIATKIKKSGLTITEFLK